MNSEFLKNSRWISWSSAFSDRKSWYLSADEMPSAIRIVQEFMSKMIRLVWNFSLILIGISVGRAADFAYIGGFDILLA